ncbi:MAG: hypothetical protein Q9217_004822 [Psora testacea]
MAVKKAATLRKAKKSSAPKQKGIKKVIENAERRTYSQDTLGTPTVGPLPASPEMKTVRLPLTHVILTPMPPPMLKFLRPCQPISTSRDPIPVTVDPEQGIFVLDRRHERKALTSLPKEPHTERALRYIPRGQFPFLELPGELRNKIYNYAIPCESYAINWVHHKQRSRSLTYRLGGRDKAFAPRLEPDVIERRRATRNLHNSVRGIIMEDVHEQINPVSLLWVCRKMYPEAATIFYGKSTFSFTFLSTLRHFLNNLTVADKAAITRLTVKYQAYGHPAKTENAIYKHKHDKAWEDLCWRIADECPSLTSLALDLNLRRCPISFGPLEIAHIGGFSTKWMQPLWAFEDRNLKRFLLKLRSAIMDGAVLEVESQNLRKAVLGEAWDQEAEAKRDAFGNDNRKKKKEKQKQKLIFSLAGEDLLAA